jgi:hypothetical protein
MFKEERIYYDLSKWIYEPIWIDKNQTKFGLYYMDTQHIERCLYLYRNGCFGSNSWQGVFADIWIKEFEDELKAREGESDRDPVTKMFYTLAEKIEMRKLQRLIHGLPSVKPQAPTPSSYKYTPPTVSLFK